MEFSLLYSGKGATRSSGNRLVTDWSRRQGLQALTTDHPMLGVIPSPLGDRGTAHPQVCDWTSTPEAG
jgi:hypothetical protein